MSRGIRRPDTRAAKARREYALGRAELRTDSVDRVAGTSPTSFPMKVEDPALRAMIDAALAKRGSKMPEPQWIKYVPASRRKLDVYIDTTAGRFTIIKAAGKDHCYVLRRDGVVIGRHERIVEAKAQVAALLEAVP